MQAKKHAGEEKRINYNHKAWLHGTGADFCVPGDGDLTNSPGTGGTRQGGGGMKGQDPLTSPGAEE